MPRIVLLMTGEELRAIRKSMGLTQVEFAALVGVAPNSIARQERGEIGIREPLARLARLLAAQKPSEKESKRRGKKS
jgi:transcriptional regulator with XRE-family HTH domain